MEAMLIWLKQEVDRPIRSWPGAQSPVQPLRTPSSVLLTLSAPFPLFSKTLQINVIDDDQYEKNKNFFLEIGEPRLLEMSERKGVPFFFCSDSVTLTSDPCDPKP